MSYLSDFLGSAYKENMTEDEISAALEATASTQENKLKAALSKANSEAAGYKKQLKEAKDSATSAASEYEALVQKVAALERDNKIKDAKARFLSVGYDETLAAETATAYADGDMEKIFAAQQTYLDSKLKAMQADMMKATPRPSGGVSEVSNVPSFASQLEQKFYTEKYGTNPKE